MSEVDICNLALANMGSVAQIADLDEASTESRFCKILYPQALKEALALHPWSFATETVQLVTQGTAPSSLPWMFQYAYPGQCVRVLRILPELPDGVPTPYQKGRSGGFNVLWTDMPDAHAEFIYYVQDTASFPPMFVNAVSWALSAMLAYPITGRTDQKKALEEMYLLKANAAYVADRAEAKPRERPLTESIRARA